MQDKIIFREMLGELKAFADIKGNKLEKEEIHEFFQNANLNDEQLGFIYEYLHGQNIKVAGYEPIVKEAAPEEKMDEKRKAEKPEEEAHLSMYLKELEDVPFLAEEEESLLYPLAAKGDALAKGKLVEHHLRTVCELALHIGEKELPVSDLIQEGNVGLILALDQMKEMGSLESYRGYIRKEVKESMENALAGQRDLKKRDNEITERVNYISQAVKNLEEDLEHKVSMEELSAYLEMPVKEIKDILKMAGDEIELADRHPHEKG